MRAQQVRPNSLAKVLGALFLLQIPNQGYDD